MPNPQNRQADALEAISDQLALVLQELHRMLHVMWSSLNYDRKCKCEEVGEYVDPS